MGKYFTPWIRYIDFGSRKTVTKLIMEIVNEEYRANRKNFCCKRNSTVHWKRKGIVL